MASASPPSPPPAWHRWAALGIVSLVTFSGYFVYDSISPIAPIIREKMQVGDTVIGLFGSLYSLPNIVMVLLGGMLIDRIGSRRAGFLFALLCTIGTAMTAAGQSITMMLAGRVVFGIGAESLILAQNKIIAKWFRGKELALAFGLNIAVCRLGSLLAFGGMAALASRLDWRGALWAACVLTVLALGAFAAYMAIDRRAERGRRLVEEQSDRLTLSDVTRFSPSFWLITVLCVTFYSAVFPFTYFSTSFFVDKYALSLEAAGRTTGILVLAAIFCTPLFGWIVDRWGRRASLMVFGSLLFAPTYFVLGATHVNPVLPMAVMGVAFSLVPAALWAAVPLIIAEKRLGTAYGVLTLIQNAGMTLLPWIAGGLTDRTGGYGAAMFLFGALGTTALLSALLLLRRERSDRGHGLERPPRRLAEALAGARRASGAPGRTRTCDTRFRKPVLYPPELLGPGAGAGRPGRGWSLNLRASRVANKRKNWCRAQSLPTAQAFQLDQEQIGRHLRPQLRRQPARGLGRAAGGQQIIDDDNPLPPPQAVGVQLQRRLAVFQGVAERHFRPGQLARFAQRHQSPPQRGGQRGGEQEAARFYGAQLVAAQWAHKRFQPAQRRAKRRRI